MSQIDHGQIDHDEIVARLRQCAAVEFKETLAHGNDLSAYDGFEYGELGIEGWLESFSKRLSFIDALACRTTIWVQFSQYPDKYLALAYDTVYEVDLRQYIDIKLRIEKITRLPFMYLPYDRTDREQILRSMATY